MVNWLVVRVARHVRFDSHSKVPITSVVRTCRSTSHLLLLVVLVVLRPLVAVAPQVGVPFAPDPRCLSLRSPLSLPLALWLGGSRWTSCLAVSKSSTSCACPSRRRPTLSNMSAWVCS